MSSVFKKYFRTIRAEQKAAEAKEKADTDAAILFMEKNRVLQAGGPEKFLGKTPVHVNDGAIFLYGENSVSSAQDTAKRFQDMGGSAIVERAETWICKNSGVEFFTAQKKDFGVITLPVKKVVYTDEKGILLPLQEVHARLHGFACENLHADTDVKFEGKAIAGEITSVGTWVSFDDETEVSSEKVSTSKGRNVSFPLTSAARQFERLVEKNSGQKRPDAKKVAQAIVATDKQKLAEKWAAIAEITSGRKEAPAANIPRARVDGPVKMLSPREQKKARARIAKRLKAAKKVNPHAAQIAKHEAKIVRLLNSLKEIRAELRGIKPGTLVAVDGGKRYEFSEIVVPEMEKRKYVMVDALKEEQNAISYLKGEI